MGSTVLRSNHWFTTEDISFNYDVNLHHGYVPCLWINFEFRMDDFNIKGEYWLNNQSALEISFTNVDGEHMVMLNDLIIYICQLALAMDPKDEIFHDAVDELLGVLTCPMF